MREDLVSRALRMLRDRERYWKECGDNKTWIAYNSAADILQYAIEGKSDCLAQFDYYGEDA